MTLAVVVPQSFAAEPDQVPGDFLPFSQIHNKSGKRTALDKSRSQPHQVTSSFGKGCSTNNKRKRFAVRFYPFIIAKLLDRLKTDTMESAILSFDGWQ